MPASYEDPERRAHPRVEVSIPIELRAPEMIIEGTMLNVSRGGAMVSIDQGLAIRTRCIIRGIAHEKFATVLRSTPRDSGFLVGLQFDIFLEDTSVFSESASS